MIIATEELLVLAVSVPPRERTVHLWPPFAVLCMVTAAPVADAVRRVGAACDALRLRFFAMKQP